MYILERSVTKPYWEASYRYLVRHMHDDGVRKVGVSTWLVPGCGLGHRRYYACFHRTEHGWRPTAWLILRKRQGWSAWEVEQVWTFPELRGKGLALRLYRAAIEHDGLTVASGRSHTKHSKGFWEKLVKKGTFKIWAARRSPMPKRFKVGWCSETNTISCATPLYTTYRNPDRAVLPVRLYAKKAA